MITPKTALIFIIVALVLGVGLYVMYPTPEEYEVPDEPIACTLEAMLCPDGSSVGRNPNNNCQFDPCPQYPPPGAIMEDGTVEEEPKQVFCTADAKLCPDGSYVGRTGPKCEFAPCPQ